MECKRNVIAKNKNKKKTMFFIGIDYLLHTDDAVA